MAAHPLDQQKNYIRAAYPQVDDYIKKFQRFREGVSGGGIDGSKERWIGLAPMPSNMPRILEATFADDTEVTTMFELYQQHRLDFARVCGKSVKAWTLVKEKMKEAVALIEAMQQSSSVVVDAEGITPRDQRGLDSYTGIGCSLKNRQRL
jgi:hypothetical protein